MLHKWLFSGELYDPFSEFFVHIDPELADAQFIQPPGLQNGATIVDDGFAGDNDDISGDYQGGLRLWESKYVFRKEMLPAFVGEDFGRKVNKYKFTRIYLIITFRCQIFSTGKSLNFIRYSCHDSDWIETREKLGTTSGSRR